MGKDKSGKRMEMLSHFVYRYHKLELSVVQLVKFDRILPPYMEKKLAMKCADDFAFP